MKQARSIADAEKLERIYVQYREFLLRIAKQILTDGTSAEDAVQNTIIKVMGNEDKIDEADVKKTQGYLATICTREAINIYNNRTQLNRDADFVEEADPTRAYENEVLKRYIEKESIAAVQEKARMLDKKYYTVFLMRFLYEYSYEKIAEELHVSPAAARKRVERIKAKLGILAEKEECLHA